MRGMGIGIGLARKAGAVLVQSYPSVSTWTPVLMTLGAGAGTDPETGLAQQEALETPDDGNHFIGRKLPLVQGRSYRLRIVLKGIGRSTFEILINADGNKYWLGDIGNATPVLASGLTNATVTALSGGLYAHTVDFTLAGASADYDLSILACAPGPLNSYPGVNVDGLAFGNVKLYEV